ncbi:MAG: 3',5'-cyclic-AMP phosphodiesterase [Steroidobacteraceae bacterium]
MNNLTNSTTRLMQLTDTHLFGDPGRSLRGVATLPALRQTLAAARAGIEACHAILATGDLVQDDPAGYAHFRAEFGALGKPVLCIPGNHDDVPAMRAALAQAPFDLSPVHDLGAWRLVQLDSSVPREVAGRIKPADLALLDDALAGAGARHVLVALHHHPIPMGSAWLDTIGLVNAAEFFAVLDRHGPVRAVLFGHVHQAFDGERRGVRLLGTPSTCSQFRPRSDHFAIDERPPAWRALQLHANGSIDTQLGWLEPQQAARLHA